MDQNSVYNIIDSMRGLRNYKNVSLDEALGGIVEFLPAGYTIGEWDTSNTILDENGVGARSVELRYRRLTDEYLEKVGLSEFADKKIYELSGGMKQRVSIARALINDPEILLMDEPFGALDALTRENVQNLTRKIWWDTGKTIFFITHDVEEALLLASRIIVLSKHPGKVSEDIQVDFSRRIMEDGETEIKFTENFYKQREKLLKLINVQ